MKGSTKMKDGYADIVVAFLSGGILALLVFAYLLVMQRHVHGVTVPDWYDIACCSQNDCRPVAADEVVEQGDGTYRYRQYVFSRALPSRDGNAHVCIHNEGKPDAIPRCVYIVQNS